MSVGRGTSQVISNTEQIQVDGFLSGIEESEVEVTGLPQWSAL